MAEQGDYISSQTGLYQRQKPTSIIKTQYIPKTRHTKSSKTKGIPLTSNMFALVRLCRDCLGCGASSPIINTRGTFLRGTSLPQFPIQRRFGRTQKQTFQAAAGHRRPTPRPGGRNPRVRRRRASGCCRSGGRAVNCSTSPSWWLEDGAKRSCCLGMSSDEYGRCDTSYTTTTTTTQKTRRSRNDRPRVAFKHQRKCRIYA